jgi:hypothetical protein
MALNERDIAKRTPDAVELRPEPARLRFRLENLPCADSHLIRILFNCSVQVLDNAIERRAFAETFLSTKTTVTADDLIAHFQPALRIAASRITPTQTAQHWIDANSNDALVQALRQAADPIEFDSGLKLLPPFDLVVESDTLHRERLDHIQREATERRAAGQLQHVQHSTELLKQFQSLRQAAPDLSASAILQRLSSTDRGDMFEALLLATPDTKPAPLWAVAGPDLLRIDTTTNPPKCDRIPLASEPFRSVQPDHLDGRPILLMGARTKVILYDTQNLSEKNFEDNLLTTQLGFNRALIHNNKIWASHAEAGIRAWNLSGEVHARIVPAQLPQPTFHRPASRPGSSSQSLASTAQTLSVAGARNLIPVDSTRLLFTVGNRLIALDASTLDLTPLAPDIQADVTALLPTPDQILVIYDNGTLLALDRQTLEVITTQHRPARTTAAELLPWLNETRLLLAHDDGCIDCIGLEDSLTTEYRSAYRDIRALAASATIVAAITADRTRIVLWHAWDGTKPYAEIHVSALTRHRVTDVCFS